MESMCTTKYIRYSVIHILLFLASCIIGFFIGQVSGDIGEISFINKPFYEYFLHNISTCMVLVGIGIITYGCLTWIPLIYNGMILGMAVCFLAKSYSALNIVVFFAHAVFEVPALMLAIYLGKVCAVELKEIAVSLVRKKEITLIQKQQLVKIVIGFGIMTVFLLVAGVIEAVPKVSKGGI